MFNFTEWDIIIRGLFCLQSSNVDVNKKELQDLINKIAHQTFYVQR